MPQPLLSKKQKLTGAMKTYRPSRININKYIFFIIGDWNAKVGGQEIPGLTGKFGLGAKNEARQRLTEF